MRIRFFILTIALLSGLFTTIAIAGEKKVNLVGEEICPNSAGSLLRDEISGMGTEDRLIVIIETDRKDIIQSAIKLEKLPVSYEEKDEEGKTIFIMKKLK